MKGLTGFNLPQHQEVISDFIYFIRKHLIDKGLANKYFVAPELRVKTSSLNDGSIIPDIVIRFKDKTWNQPILIIEVSRTRGFKTDIAKTKKALRNIRSLKESFVFNYETGVSCRIVKPDIDEETGKSYSKVLEMDLISCLRG